MSDLDEQIWREDMERWTQDIYSVWKTQYRLWQRAQAQGAPPALVNELSAVCTSLAEAYNKLSTLPRFFPKQRENSS